MYGVIYKATNKVNGKIYIGQTAKSLEDRRYEHEYESENLPSNKVFHKAIRKYGKSNFAWEQIDVADSKDELNAKEIFWIEHYKSYVGNPECNGYNMTIGGEGGGYAHTEETKLLLSNMKKGTSAFYGKSHSDESKAKMSKAHKGKKFSDETKQKMSDRMQGVVTNAKPVVQLSLDGEFIAEYESAKQAMNLLGVNNASNITECCKGKRKTAYKFKWIYKEDYIDKN